MFDLPFIGQRVRAARQRGGISQAELGDLAGVSRATINALENGTIKEIGVNRLSRIVDVATALPPKQPDAAPARDGSKSERLGLSFPYDWSNPNISDDALIMKVVEYGIFTDLVRIVSRYGFSRVNTVATAFAERTPPAAVSLNRMMRNIESALQHV